MSGIDPALEKLEYQRLQMNYINFLLKTQYQNQSDLISEDDCLNVIKEEEISHNYIFKSVIKDHQVIFITLDYDLQILSHFDIDMMIIDDAQSMGELNSLRFLSYNPKKIVFIGDLNQPKQVCFQVNSEITHYNKSLFQRMLEGGARFENINYQIRMHQILCEFVSKMFYNENLRTSRNIKIQKQANPIGRIMKRVFFFDLHFLKEFKENVFKSDFEEINFSKSLILDIVRLVGENQNIQMKNDTQAMSEAFKLIKGKIGIIVPFPKFIEAYKKIIFDVISTKLNAKEEDIMIGTPDMFRGVEKELIIISTLRNSVVDGLGYFDEMEYINLAMTRASHSLWVIGSSPTLTKSYIWNKFIGYCKFISNQKYKNYMKFESYIDYKGGNLQTLLRSFQGRVFDQEDKNSEENKMIDPIKRQTQRKLTFQEQMQQLVSDKRQNKKRNYNEYAQRNNANKTIERDWENEEEQWGQKKFKKQSEDEDEYDKW